MKAVTLVLVLLAAALAAAPSDRELHMRAIVVDTHADTTQRIADDHLDIGKPQPELHLDLPKMKAGGLDAEFFSIWVDPKKVKPEGFHKDALRQLDAVHDMIRKNAKVIAWAKTAADVRENAKRGLLSALFGVEGGHMLLPGTPDEQIARLRKFYELGARYMTLTWSNSNPIGGSSGDEGDIQGLTDFGRRVVDEMQRLGMMIDISHVSDPTFWDVIRYVRKPVIASHSSARSLCNVPRNMTDAMLRAVGKNGGAVCVNFYPGFLDIDYTNAIRPIHAKYKNLPVLEAERREREEAKKLPRPGVARLVDHIDHIAKVAGVEHVCLGSDYDGIEVAPLGVENVAQLPAITVELRKRGYSPADVEKILGGNTLRVLEANQSPAPAGAGGRK